MVTIFGLISCTTWKQTLNTVLVRGPSTDGYLAEQAAATTATAHLPYAVLSANVYGRTHEQPVRQSNLDDLVKRPCKEIAWPVSMPNWQRWWAFPDDDLRKVLHGANMHVEVWEDLSANPQIVIAFEGTVFTSRDHWKANLRWFLRFIPKYKDQYTVASKAIAEAFHKVISQSTQKYSYDPNSSSLRLSDGRPVRIVTTGHSLGGGLAQQFAYAFVQPSNPPTGPRINEVFAFDASPVTGWFSTSNPPRDYNATDLRINRIVEHGEVLAYLRIFTSNLALRASNPEMWIYRYNFEVSPDIIGSHSMQKIACGIANSIPR